jgi:hypothetical protein
MISVFAMNVPGKTVRRTWYPVTARPPGSEAVSQVTTKTGR